MTVGRVGFVVCLAISLAMTGPVLFAEQPQPPSDVEIAQAKLDRALDLYSSGEYLGSQDLVEKCIAEYETGVASYPLRIIARLYGLDALLAYSFRDAGYKERIDRQLQKGLELDLDLDLGDPGTIPSEVLDRFAKIKAAYLRRFARSTRRNAFGLFGSLILEPTMFQNPALFQPGISYTFNFTDSLTLDARLRFPLQIPIWSSIRAQLGLTWYPSFNIEKIATGVSLWYTFGLDNLVTTTHSLSLGAKLELVTRSGLGIVTNAELVRADLILGSTSPPQAPSYNQIPLLGLFDLVFANVTVSLFYTF